MKILLVAASLCLAACASTGPDTVMKMRKITAERMISSADAPEDRDVAVSTVGIGPSVPDSDPIHNINPGKMVRLFRDSGPSRISGGERFSFTLLDANKKPYTDQLVAVRVIAYSKSGKGKLLVRNAEAVPAQPAPFFDPLFRFSALPTGAKAEQHGDNVLLSDHEHVILYQDNAFPLSRIILAVEGFGDNDSSFAVQTVSATLGKVGTSTDVRRAIVNPPPACPSGYFQASHSVCCPDGTRFDGRGGCNSPPQENEPSAPTPSTPVAAPHHRKCDTNADCPGFANSCFAGNCEAEDSGQCNSNADCPGFANSCFAGHCESKDTTQCNSNADCHGFANSCFAGHCSNP
jgi:hypothetical protein